MSGIRAVVVDPDAPNRLALADVEEPSPTPSETLVRVSAVSLNRGDALRFHPVPRSAGETGLARSRHTGAAGGLKPRIEVEAPWTEVGEIARRLIERGYTGKAVLRVGSN